MVPEEEISSTPKRLKSRHDFRFSIAESHCNGHDPAAILAEMRRVCRRDGRIVVIDATPAPHAQAAYDRMETLRDPTHTSALTLEQLRAIGREAGLSEVLVDSYRLEARLDTLADAQDLPALTQMFDADIAEGNNTIGVGAWRAADGLRFVFPISIIAWAKPQA